MKSSAKKYLSLSWNEAGDGLIFEERYETEGAEEPAPVVDIEPVKQTSSRKITVRQVQNQFGGTLTDYQAAVYAELHNCE